MIRNGVDWSKVYVDATLDEQVHEAILGLMVRKSGFGWLMGHSTSHATRFIGLGGLTAVDDLIMGVGTGGRKEMSISELAALPDYQPTKRMTVPEICDALGYDVEIVKGGK